MSNLVKGQSAILFTLGKYMCGDNHSPVKSIGKKFITLENGFRRAIDSADMFIASSEAAKRQLVHAFNIPVEVAEQLLALASIEEAVELFRVNLTCFRRNDVAAATKILTELRDTHYSHNV